VAPSRKPATNGDAKDGKRPRQRQAVRAAHATRQHNEALRRLVVRLGEHLTTANDTEAILRTSAECLLETTGADGCDIFLLDGELLRCAVSLTQSGLDEEFTGTTVDLGAWTCTAEAITERKPFVIPDRDDTRLTDDDRAELEAHGYHCQLCNPLVVEDQVIGVIHLCDTEPRDFAECFDFVRDVSHLAAATLANELLLEQLRGANRGLKVLAAAGFEIGATLDLEQVLNTIARSMCQAAEAKTCDIYSLDGDVIRGLASADGDVVDSQFRGTTFPVADNESVQRVVEGGKPVAVVDMETDPKVPEAEKEKWRQWGLRSGLGLPLVSDGQTHGVVFLWDDHPREFHHDELLEGLTRIAAQAMANAETFRGLEMRSRENELLAEIARHTTSTLNVQQISRSMLGQLKGLIPFDRAGILLGTTEQRPELAYAWHKGGPVAEPHFGPEIASFWRDLERERVIVLDIPEEAPAGSPMELIRDARSAAAVALLLNERIVGCLALGSVEPEAFVAVDRGLLQRLGNQLALALNNARLYEDIQRMHMSNLKALSSALNAKDYYTLGHAARVSAYMLLLGHELGWPPDVHGQIEEAAYLHDIGKIGISDRVLLKPSGLNSHEWELMRHHPIFSADIIRPLFNEELVLGVRHHHERWDGRGYPDGLDGKEIPLIARAMGVVDSYDAMSFRRPYRNARSYTECRAELKRCRGTQFDPQMVDAFMKMLRKLAERRRKAVSVAEKAARRLDLAKHALLVSSADGARPEYEEIAVTLRKVRDANPPTRFIETMGHIDGKYVMIVDCDDDPVSHVPLGDEIYADQELPEAFAGMRVDAVALVVDQWGAWVSGRVPVMGPDDRVVAVVAVDLPPTDEIDLEGLHSDVIESFAGLIKRTASQGARAELEAITDGHTGLYNLRYLHGRLDEEVERAREAGESLTLLLCDVDEFRTFNEGHGYDEGDRALRAIALIIEGSLRGVDLAARYGGDEFAAVLVDTDAAGAAEVAERIRAAIASAHFTADRDKLTVSIGHASFPADGDNREQLVDKAEWARRSAKRRGRDVAIGFSERRKK